MAAGDFMSKVAKNIIFPLVNSALPTNSDGLKLYKTKSGLNILFRDKSLDRLIIWEQWEIQEYSNVEVKEGDIVIDLGSCIGTSAMDYSIKVGDKGFVYSVEADKSNFDIFNKNIQYNNMKNVKSFHLAIVGDPSINEIELEISPYNTAGHSINNLEILNVDKVKCKAMTLEKFCSINKINNINILQMDIEGAEYDIINKINVDFIKKIPTIVFEYHDTLYSKGNHNDLINYFNELGYKTFETRTTLSKILNLKTGIIVAKRN